MLRDLCVVKVKNGKNGVFHKVEDAIRYIKEQNYCCEVNLYDIKESEVRKKTAAVYQHIKKYNKGKNIDEQIIPTNAFCCYGIEGCLSVHVHGISMDTYKNNYGCLALFTGWNSSVLDNNKLTSTVDNSFAEPFAAPWTE